MPNFEEYDNQEDEEVDERLFWFIWECKGFLLRIKDAYHYFLPPSDDRDPLMH